jgi:hypothetical protein
MFVVDWEMMQLNVPAVDYGEMAAELYYFSVFKSLPAGKWLLEGFADAYGTVSEDFAYRALMQIGAHLICVILDLGRLPESQFEKAVSVGKDILVHAWRKDRAWFEDSDLACIVRQIQ